MVIFRKYLPILIFLFFVVLIIKTTLFYAPSWGLMDDFQNLEHAKSVWVNNNSVIKFISAILQHFKTNAYYRPLYEIWSLFTYYIFKNSPLTIYILIIIQNMAVLLLWGRIFHRIFSSPKENIYLNVFIFPLSFFLFTPFWNIFMYISLPEKLIFLFSALALYFLMKTFDTNRLKYFWFSFSFVILGILSKPTGIYLALAFAIFAFLALFIRSNKKRITFTVMLANLSIFLFYYLFTIKKQCRGYTVKYNLSIEGIQNNLFKSPFVIKFLAILAIFMAIYIFIALLIKRKKNVSIEALLIPLGFLSYIFILLPWGILNYHLSVATPYVLGMFFPTYTFFNKKSMVARILVNIFIVFLTLLTFFYIIKPRISKMADIKETINFMKGLSNGDKKVLYFFPPPYSEPPYALSNFTNSEVIFLGQGTLSKEMFRDAYNNYLIFDERGTSIDLINVKVDKEVYRNNTWRIYLLKEENYKTKFKPDFPKENFLEKIKTYLRTKS